MRPEHSTFEIIRSYARMMRHAVVATPPRQECELSCWIPVSRYGFDTCAMIRRSSAFAVMVCARHHGYVVKPAANARSLRLLLTRVVNCCGPLSSVSLSGLAGSSPTLGTILSAGARTT